jgi:flagellum-specific peptidoglycan hydrolase FlgJ
MRTTTTIIAMMLAMAALGQTKEQVTAEIQRQGIPHPDIVLAQARLETGNFKSDRCRRDHNLFGIKHGKKYARYRTWQESVADYKARISTRYKGGDYYAFLRRIGYAKDPKYTAKLKQF